MMNKALESIKTQYADDLDETTIRLFEHLTEKSLDEIGRLYRSSEKQLAKIADDFALPTAWIRQAVVLAYEEMVAAQ